MKRKYFGVTFCLFILTAGLVAAFSSGPPDGRTGAPGDSNCTVACHSTFVLNSGNGTLTINGPSTYDPNGGTAIINISIAQAGQSRWGFEATALDTNNNFVGAFMNDDPNRTQISTSGAREYIKHTSVGTDAGTVNASPGWTIFWVSPADFGPVTIYVASNAANNNGFNTGDFIYTDSFTIIPTPASCCVNFRGNVDGDSGDTIDISDLVFLVSFMFSGGANPPCIEEADIDGSGSIDISDLVGLVAFMFSGGLQPANCL